MMPKAHPIELRERVVAHVDAGHSHRETAAHFRVSVKFVNDMIKLRRETGSLEAKPVGNNLGHGKLEPVKDWLVNRVSEKGEITLNELRLELEEQFGLEVHPSNIARRLHSLGYSHKKRPFMPRNSIAARLEKLGIAGKPNVCLI